jgi:prevent-host-death family protein
MVMSKARHDGSHEVGVRELRADLSKWLTRIEAGEEVVVTDRDRPVARLVKYEPRSGLEDMIARGKVSLPTKPKQSAAELRRNMIKGPGNLSDLIIEERERGR